MSQNLTFQISCAAPRTFSFGAPPPITEADQQLLNDLEEQEVLCVAKKAVNPSAVNCTKSRMADLSAQQRKAEDLKSQAAALLTQIDLLEASADSGKRGHNEQTALDLARQRELMKHRTGALLQTKPWAAASAAAWFSDSQPITEADQQLLNKAMQALQSACTQLWVKSSFRRWRLYTTVYCPTALVQKNAQLTELLQRLKMLILSICFVVLAICIVLQVDSHGMLAVCKLFFAGHEPMMIRASPTVIKAECDLGKP